MRYVPRWLGDPILIVTLALLSATVLVIYLQREAFAALERQSVVIREKILEQTAREIALQIRTAIDAPAYDTLSALTRGELLAGGLPRVQQTYEEAVRLYPHIDRFFVWSDDTERRTPGEVLFFSDGRFVRDPELGAFIYQGIRAASVTNRTFVALEHRTPGCTYDVLAHYYWLEPDRNRYFFLLGYVVCVEGAGPRLVRELYAENRTQWLNQDDGDGLDLHVIDDREKVVFGPAQTGPRIAAGSVSFPAQFYPARRSLATAVSPREWTIHVTSSAPAPTAMRTQGVWLLGLSILLILVALAVAVRGQKRASELARMQAAFVSHVSHQLRTPLSLLTAITDTLALDRVKSPEKAAQYMEIARRETERLSMLVERILEFSRVGGGARTYQFESVDLVALVRETVRAFAEKPAAAAFGMRVEDDGQGCTMPADPVALEQALVNLLDNAVKYSNGGGEVVVRVRRTPGEVTVEVEDHGIGIPSAEQRRIFDRFYRGSGAGGQRGFGLGLAIAKEVVGAHHGRIEVESTPGLGTLFRLRLPLHDRARGFRALVRARVGASRPSEITKPA